MRRDDTDRNAMLPRQWSLEFLSRGEGLATQLVAADLKAAAVAEPHILVPDAAPVGLMRFAHQATGTR